jgi:hypothetical protein
MADLLFLSSVLNYRIDMQTYFKCQLNLLNSVKSPENQDLGDSEKSDALLYYKLLFENDCRSEIDL